MSGLFQRDPRAGAFLGGDRVSGQDIRDQNGLASPFFVCEVPHARPSRRCTIYRKHYQKLTGSIGPRQDARRQYRCTVMSLDYPFRHLIFTHHVGSGDI